MKEIEGIKIIPNPATLTNELLRVAGFTGWFIIYTSLCSALPPSFCQCNVPCSS